MKMGGNFPSDIRDKLVCHSLVIFTIRLQVLPDSLITEEEKAHTLH